ncbi:MAG: hypothetical protein KGL39_00840 [Patescibacteria group bacterium]|nr:hypothetical protein [Patescibacteria group bacterium]
MKVTSFAGGDIDRRILLAMITSTEALSRIIPLWQEKPWDSSWLNRIGRECVRYFNRHGEAPNSAIQDWFSNVAEHWRDKEAVREAEIFLEIINGEGERSQELPNPNHIYDLAMSRWEEISLRRLSNDINHAREQGNLEEARSKVFTWAPPAASEREFIDVLQDMEAVRRACTYSRQEPLITYDQGLGDFFGDSLRKDSFIAFMGPDKSGKSMWLLDVAFRAVLARKRTVYFEAGDLSEDQVMERIVSRIMRRPARPGPYDLPTEMFNGKPPRVVSKEKVCEKHLNFKLGWEAFQSLVTNRIRSNEPYWKLHCSPNSTLQVSTIRSMLKRLLITGWPAEVVIVDYADILASPSGIKETRDQSNAIWKQLRAISQEFNCLVVTATQTNAKSYTAEIVNRTNFSEDKRKLAHVTGMVGISASVEEKEMGLCRLNWVVRRERGFSDRMCCYAAGCLAICNPSMFSVF